MKYVILVGASLSLLAGCVKTSTYDGGVSYREYQRQNAPQREAELRGGQPTYTTTQVENGSSSVAPVEVATAAPTTTAAVNAAGISEENNFDNVSNTRTIQSDAERLAQNRAQYQVIQPTELPSRTGTSGPNIVEYALRTNNPRGVPLYSRSGRASANGKYQQNCSKYASSDLAQEDFLTRGGPQKDQLGIDPDGDGYACNWDPAPFRKLSL